MGAGSWKCHSRGKSLVEILRLNQWHPPENELWPPQAPRNACQRVEAAHLSCVLLSLRSIDPVLLSPPALLWSHSCMTKTGLGFLSWWAFWVPSGNQFRRESPSLPILCLQICEERLVHEEWCMMDLQSQQKACPLLDMWDTHKKKNN